jgi:hypothetical protein
MNNIYNKIVTENFPNLEKTMLIQIQEASRTPIRKEEEIKQKQIGKGTAKISLFAEDMILYHKDLKNSTQKLLDTINTFSTVA